MAKIGLEWRHPLLFREWTAAEQRHSNSTWPGIAVQVVAIALVHLLVMPGVTKRSTSPALIVPGLVIGVLGVITLAFVFWSGIPIILGLAAAALGAAGREGHLP